MDGTRIIKPRHLSILHRTFRHQGQDRLCLTGLAMFDFDRPADLLSDQVLWPTIGEQLGDAAILDMAMPKVRGEVLVYGKAMAPRGDPVQALDVGVALGPVAKMIRVFGDRIWYRPQGWTDLRISDPVPFTEMPLDDTRAFGGPGYEANPVGLGFGAETATAAGHTPPLANLEHPAHPIASVDQEGMTVGLGAIDFALPQRQRKAGSYDQAWLDTDFPELAHDIDWTIFNASAPDQWINGYFAGDETFSVQGFHPDYPSDGSHLPGCRIRGFVRQKTGTGPTFYELPMMLDTIWLFPTIRKGVIAWRGLCDISDSNGLDVTDLLIAAESLDAPPRTLEHYSAVRDRRASDDDAAFDFFNDAPLMPQESPEIVAARQVEQDRLRAERREEREEKTRRMIEKALIRSSGPETGAVASPGEVEAMVRKAMEPDEFSGLLDELPAVTDQMIEAGNIDMAAIMDVGRKIGALAEEKAKEAEQLARTEQQNALAERANRSPATLAASEAALKAKLDRAVLGTGMANGFDIDTFLTGLSDAGSLDGAGADSVRAALAESGGKMAEGLYEGRRAAPEPVGPMDPLTPEMADYLGGLIRQAVAEGRSLAGRDFAGANLRGIVLADADLTKSMAERADLGGAVLSGAKADGLVLAGANLSHASLSGASLVDGNLASVYAEAADFSRANLTNCSLMKANFSGGRLEGATLENNTALEAKFHHSRSTGMRCSKSIFIEADFSGSVLDRAEFSDVLFINARFDGATFRDARFKNCFFYEPIMDRVDFEGASLDTCGMVGEKASFIGASFRAVNVQNCTFRDNDFSALDFSTAKLEASDLCGANFTDANLERASLIGAIALKANFDRARLSRANLHGTLLTDTRLTETDLRAAVLYGTDLTGAQFDETDFRDAFVSKVKMPK